MEWNELLLPALWFALLGGLFGILLAVASRLFAVKTDPRVPEMQEVLPGANCGGCGYTGCSAYAEAIARGDAPTDRCSVGGGEVAARLAEIMGVAPTGGCTPRRAVVLCSAGRGAATKKYLYEGAPDCVSAARLAGGDKLCPNGCIGLGTCVAACPFGAIRLEDGVAVVDPEKCSGCGTCTAACPKHILHVIPADAVCYVGCSSVDNGKVTRSYCTLGCISCRLCEKKCPADAIHVNDFVASIDYDLCTRCGQCAQVCPRHIIHPVAPAAVSRATSDSHPAKRG